MVTISQFAEHREVPVQTVYSWIYRNKAEENGFRVIQIGKVKMIEEITTQYKVLSQLRKKTGRKQAGKLPVKKK